MKDPACLGKKYTIEIEDCQGCDMKKVCEASTEKFVEGLQNEVVRQRKVIDSHSNRVTELEGKIANAMAMLADEEQ